MKTIGRQIERSSPVTAESLEHGRGCSTVILPSGQALVASELGLVRVLACLALDEWEKTK